MGFEWRDFGKGLLNYGNPIGLAVNAYEAGRKALKKPVVTPTYAPYTLSADQVRSQYGTPSGGYGGDPGFQYKDITITDPAILGNRQAREAEIQKQAAFQERQASLYRNQSRERDIDANYKRLIEENRVAGLGYGNAQRARLEREASANLAASQAAMNQRGLGSTSSREAARLGSIRSYNQARGELEENLAARQQAVQNSLEGARLGFLTNINDQPMSFSDVAAYGQQPEQVLAAIQAQQFAADQARKQRTSQILGDLGSAAITGAGYLFGGPAGGMLAGAGANALRGSQQPTYAGGSDLGYIPFNPYAAGREDTTGGRRYGNYA